MGWGYFHPLLTIAGDLYQSIYLVTQIKAIYYQHAFKIMSYSYDTWNLWCTTIENAVMCVCLFINSCTWSLRTSCRSYRKITYKIIFTHMVDFTIDNGYTVFYVNVATFKDWKDTNRFLFPIQLGFYYPMPLFNSWQLFYYHTNIGYHDMDY